MGGTSFDVGIIVDDTPRMAQTALHDRFRLYVPTVEVVSIGAGGGSIAWIDPLTGTLHVGPQSAGSEPGPVCYGRGGTEPTVTDADVVLNRISPERFFGGRQKLDREAALRAIQDPLGYDPLRAAKGIVDIVDARMADLIRKLTIENGLDPRQFVLFAYGGAGPTHVGAFGREIGLRYALVSPYAPVFSALGIAASDIVRYYSRSEPMRQPVDHRAVGRVFLDLERQAERDVPGDERRDGGLTLDRFVDMRFRYQVHEIRVPVPWEIQAPEDVERLAASFVAIYEQTFGQGTALKDAGVELLTFHVASRVRLPNVALTRHPPTGPDADHARTGTRPVFWDDGFVETPVYDQQRLRAGNRISGPAVIEAPNTTILIHPGQTSWLDEYLNTVIAL
jgi:N-methylhydantoinase A